MPVDRWSDAAGGTGSRHRRTPGAPGGPRPPPGAVGGGGFGCAGRQWGPGLFDGLQLSPSAYATDQLWGTVRFWRFELTTIAQRLDDQPGDSASGLPAHRDLPGA